MSNYLQRLGRFSFVRRRLVVGVWLAVLLAVGTGATLAGGSFSSSFSIPGTESQRALDLLQQRLPAASAAGAHSRLVFAAANGSRLTGNAHSAIERTLAQVAANKTVASVTDPFATGTVSRDQTVAYSTVVSTVKAGQLTQADRSAVVRAERAAQAAGVHVYVSGDLGAQTQPGGTEGIGVAVALLVLIVTFGSIIAAGLPLLSAALGVGIGVMGIALTSAFINLSSAATTLAMMLGLAVGIDYALLILSRHRSQVHEGVELEDSVAHAVGTAGSAVVFAGSTVMIALVALITTGVPFMAAMGLAAAGTVAVAVLIALTLVPALLGFAGGRAVKGKRLKALADHPGARTLGARWVEFVTRHRVPAIGLTTLATLALAVPALHLRLGLPDDSTARPGTQQRQAYDLVTRAFGPGASAQLTVVASIPDGTGTASATTTIRARLSALRDVAAVSAARVSPDNTLAIITVTPSSGPSTAATTNLVQAIRAERAAIRASTGAELSVTGTTAVNIDVAQRMSDALIPYLAVIVSLAFLLLAIAFRSILVPLSAMAGFLLSITAALGAMVAVFQDGFAASLFGITDPAPIVSLLPILLVGIIFGLAMDYQVFLVSRMREAHAHGADPHKAVHDGFQHSARVVTAAGLIMVSVFAGFIVPDDPIVKSMGFAMTVGILIDAFLIRMTLIPAVMSLLGKHAWWLPHWLDKLIPNVDLEGAALARPGTSHRRHVATPSRAPAYAESRGS
jgi:putative drug exporter of the RND superfamily